MEKWLAILLLSFLITFVAAETYYATPSPDIPCPQPGVPCFTLSQYAAVPSGYFSDYTILILMSGSHSLDANFSIRGIQDLDIVAPSPDNTSVTCQGAGRFVFQDIQYIHISDMELTGCTHSIVSVQEFTLEGSNLRGQGNESREVGLELRNVNKGHIASSNFTSFVRGQHNFSTGGAVIIYNSNVTITGSNFEENQANIGGAVFINQTSTVNIEDCVFGHNSVIGDYTCSGGAIHVAASVSIVRVVVKKSLLKNNTACNGGAISSAYLAYITIANCEFVENTATYGDGGAAFLYGPSKVIDSLFLYNNASREGGATKILYNYETTVSGSTFAGNSAKNGGACMLGSIKVINDCRFDFNIAFSGGGAIVSQGSSLTINNSNFNYNSAQGGGAIYVIAVSNLYLLGNKFVGNQANKDGGAITMLQSLAFRAIINMTDTEFLYNEGPAPAIYIHGPFFPKLVVNVYGYLHMEGNKGQGVWWAESYSTNIAGHVTIFNNTGGFYVNDGNLIFNGTTEFSGNTYQSNETSMPQAAAVSCLNGKVTFHGSTKILYDPGVHGGPIASVGCTVSMTGDLTVHNSKTLPHCTGERSAYAHIIEERGKTKVDHIN